MRVCVSVWMPSQMTSNLCFLLLSSLAVSLQLGLEDVFFSPQEQTVTEGEGVFFRCVSGESSAPASISWLKDENVVTRGRQIQGEYGGGNQKKTSGTLHLSNATLEDDGFYICVTHNALLNVTKRSRPAKLTVLGVPRLLQILQGPNNLTVAAGTEVSMNCTVGGFPLPIVHWFKDGSLLTNCSLSCSMQNNGQLLTFRNVTKEDEGFYHCEASNLRETIKSESASLLVAEMDWRFAQQPTNLTVKRGENVTVVCRPPYSRPAAQVSWLKDNHLLSPTAHVTVLPSGDLFFNSVQEYDSGSYFCRASNVHLQRFLTSKRATLTVLAPPSVKLWPQVTTAPVGAQVELECQVSGHPPPSISWMKRGQSKQTGGKIAMGLRNSTLYIQSARSYDEGVYVCEATNKLGQSRSTAILRVAVSPIIVTFIGQVSCRIGSSMALPCNAVGIQPISYTWTRGTVGTHSAISSTDNMQIDDGALHISSVQYSHGGEYYCTAENRAGRHQRRTVLTVTAEDHPADRDKQTTQVLSAKSSDSLSEKHVRTTHPPSPHACSSSPCDARTNGATTSSTVLRRGTTEPKMQMESPNHPVPQHKNQPTNSPTQPLVTHMQPPMLPPPPHPNFQSVDFYTHLPETITPLSITNRAPPIRRRQTYLHTENQPDLTLTPSPMNFHHQVSDKILMESNSKGSNVADVSAVSQITQTFTEASVTHPTPELPAGETLTPTETQLHLSPTQSHQLITESHLSQSHHEPTPTQIIQTVLKHPGQPQHHKSHPQLSSAFSDIPEAHPHQPFVPKFHLELSSTSQRYLPSTQPSAITELQFLQVQPSAMSTLPQTQTQPPLTQHPQLSTLPPQISVSPQLDRSRLNATQQGGTVKSTKSADYTEVTDWLKRNTSQSPMTSNDPRVTQQSPSWLPVMEKHDIPIVVGVGVSLAFIFITVTFYSVVQKNEPAPTSRAAQRNLGVPVRHAERRAAGRTYDNRAFEDDDFVAVIEQSPNTSDTRARPPGPSLVTVQMEPTFEDSQEGRLPALDEPSITVETFPEPILDTKIDSSLEDEKGCSLSQPSIQLQCAEDWTSNRGDNHSPCQDALPPPSSLPSCSPSPSPPSRHEEGLRSSLTLQSAEPCVAPVHHSLSISHGNPPLLLSHHVSMGLTTVAVDVHFYPASTASVAVGTSTHISSVSNSTTVTAPLFSPPLGSTQGNESAARGQQCT